MRCICSHATALWYWYLRGPARLLTAQPYLGNALEGAAHTRAQISHFDLAGAGINPCPPSVIPCANPGGELDLLVSPDDSWRAPEDIRLHRWYAGFPAGSLYVVGNGVLVCSPELALLQVARSLTDTQLIRLVLSLCGRYYINPETDKACERNPLTTIAKIRQLLAGVPGRLGIRRLNKVLALCDDDAASPTEVETYMLACLPARMGGYGLAGAELNGKIDLSGTDGRLLDKPDRQFVRVDLYWHGKHVGIEYQSKDHDVVADRRRINMLTSLGEDIFQVDASQRSDTDRFDATMAQVAKRLGREVPALESEWVSARGALRRELLGANRMRL